MNTARLLSRIVMIPLSVSLLITYASDVLSDSSSNTGDYSNSQNLHQENRTAVPGAGGIGPGDNQYRNVSLFISDGIVASRNDFFVLDPSLSLLSKDFNWNDAQRAEFRIEAERFYKERFGFDFSGIEPDANGIKMIPGVAVMVPYKVNEKLNYHSLYDNGKGRNVPFDDNGYLVQVIGQNVTYYGDFGGELGKPASQGELMFYGYYVLQPDKKNQQTSILFKSLNPTRTNEDGVTTFLCEMVHPVWGNGLGFGTTAMTPQSDGTMRAWIRNAVVYPPFGNIQ